MKSNDLKDYTDWLYSQDKSLLNGCLFFLRYAVMILVAMLIVWICCKLLS